jgi:hypothetical protein
MAFEDYLIEILAIGLRKLAMLHLNSPKQLRAHSQNLSHHPAAKVTHREWLHVVYSPFRSRIEMDICDMKGTETGARVIYYGLSQDILVFTNTR